MLDRGLLVKLLNMTESQHDAEALAAIRRSNDLLRRSKTTWTELLAPPTKPETAPAPPKAQPRSAPRQKSAGWGSDLWGDEPALPPAAKRRR